MELVPEHKIPNKSDNLQRIVCESSSLAKKKYLSACKKLMQINNWGKIGETILKTEFSLCDENGLDVKRLPQINDFIKINLAGPGSKSGDGFDWVQIEEIITKNDSDDIEFNSIKVRPAGCPLNESTCIAHFFDAAATSTFIVSKKQNEVTAEIHGRNEEPNKSTAHLADNVRNILVATAAAAMFSDVQWKKLCICFLS